MKQILLYCRPGFESDAAAEIQEQAANLGFYGFVKAKADTGYLLWNGQTEEAGLELIQQLSFQNLIFCRQWMVVLPMLSGLSVDDRITPIVNAVENLPRWQNVLIETPDNDESKSLSPFLKAFKTPVTAALKKVRGRLPPKDVEDWCLHLCFISSTALYVGVSNSANASPYPMGIPRLKMPRQAPSRSTLKLEEAWLTFFGKEKMQTLFANGGSAVDLGAAPGGWTYQLVKQGFLVTAVDNGPMQNQLMETGAVQHVKQDGFVYAPLKPVDWMVCDIVDKPARVMDMIIHWAQNRWAEHFIFNLKLPMKKRYQEVQKLKGRLEEALFELGISFQFQAKQLYHDREEITCYLHLRGIS